MFGFGKNTIKVEFFKSGEAAPFAVSDVPVAQLPDTFAVNTTLHIGGEDWTVVNASPMDKPAFRKTGKLQLVLTKPSKVMLDPGTILFSLPTITNDIPATIPATSLTGVAIFHEDDWRQTEFITAAQQALIDDEITAIADIYANERQGPGFRNLHLRQRIAQPLAGQFMTVGDLEGHFGVRSAFKGVGFNSATALIQHGFAFVTDGGGTLWGQTAEDGTIAFLNLRSATPAGDRADTGLDEFLSENRLYLVDWPAMTVRTGDSQKRVQH